MKKALILIDIQNDFLPTGALPVRNGDKVIPVANRLADHFDLVAASKDWHPADHKSFAANHPWRKPGQIINKCISQLRELPPRQMRKNLDGSFNPVAIQTIS